MKLFHLLIPVFLLLIMASCKNKEKVKEVVVVNKVENSSEPVEKSQKEKLATLNAKIVNSPTDYQLRYDRSLLHYQMGNSEKAVIDIDKAIDLFPDNPESFYLKGFYSYVQNKNEVARHLFELAALKGSTNPENYYQLGQISFLEQKYDEAKKHYNNAMKFDSLDPLYPFALGFLEENIGKSSKAREFYKVSLEKDPGFIKALSQLHDLELNVFKNGVGAQDYNNKILAIDSLHPIGRFNQGNMYFKIANDISDPKRKQEFNLFIKFAISNYSKAILRDARFSRAIYNRGYCFFLIDDYNSALTDFETVTRLSPTNSQAFFMIASINEYFGDLKSALKNYKIALNLNSDFTDARKAISEIQQNDK